METNQYYNYEESMINFNEVLDLIADAIQNHSPLSLGRYGHGEIAYIGWADFPEWKNGFEPHSDYAGATASATIIQGDLLEALRTTDIVGLHASWGYADEDREAARLTSVLVQHLGIRPKYVCSAFITHEMIKSDRFWSCLKNQRVALVGRRAAEAYFAFKNKGIDVTCTINLEGYEEMENVFRDLSKREDWDVALLAAGIPATVLAPRLANYTSRVVIDFGHALDKLVDGENFNYEKILQEWNKGNVKRMLVSIVMAVYNGAVFLKEAVSSVLSQTYTNIELIIVNDGSTDSTKTILDTIDDKRVRVIHLEKNQGAANALNIGIMQANGAWIAIQDADDNSYPTKIEEQVNYIIKHPELVGVGTLIDCIPGCSDVSKGILSGVANNKNSFVTRKEIRKGIYWGCPLTHSSVMFSKDVFWEVGGYNPDFKIAYDYDLWLKLLEKGEIENVPKVLLHYRIYKESLSNRDGIATVNEIQNASSRGICRLLRKDKTYQPKVVVIGSLKGCKNYYKNIAPISGLEVDTLIYKDWYEQIPKVLWKIISGKIDAIIVLSGILQEKVLNLLERRNLKLNEQVFNIYNILE